MEQQKPYRILIEPVAGRVRASFGGELIADSEQVMLLRESYLPLQYYFPKTDLSEGVLEPSQHRTFCPFKGTAEYWHLRLPDGPLENGAWSYVRPLDEARDIGGHIALSPHPELTISVDPPIPEPDTQLFGGNPLIDWLVIRAWHCGSPRDLTEQFAAQLVALGIPLWRMDVNLWTLHPELAGQRITWMRDRGEVVESDTPHGILKTQAYLDSPVRYVSDGLGGVRQRLDVDEPEFRFPILEQLKADGGTDYVAMPLPFSDGQIQTLTLTSDHPDGFSTADLGQVFGAVFVLARLYEVMTLRDNAKNLFDTYLGAHTGRQVLAGLTRRGDGENIRAAILFCDLRDSTALSESLTREDYLDLLNKFFERAAGPVLEAGGEVLKFIGDAVLAIFPLDPELPEEEATGNACRTALAAAQEIVRQVASFPARADGITPQCGIGLHFGDVTYGNVGAPGRLDFTVIGSAANVAARLGSESKSLDQSLVVSGEVAQHASDELRSAGHRQLRNVSHEVEVFVPAGAAFG